MRAQRWWMILILAIMLGLGGAGASARAAEPIRASELTAAERLLAARAAASQVSSYRLQGEALSATQGTIDVVTEYVAPDRARLRLQTVAEPVTAIETIVIGTTAYLNVGGDWTIIEGDPNAAAQASQFDLRRLLDALDPAAVSLRGVEEFNGEPCAVLMVDRDGETLALWIADRDSLVRKLEGIGAQMTITLVVTDLNTPIEINAPV